MSEQPKKLQYCVNGEWLTSNTKKYMDCYNPSTGEVIAQAPQCTAEEVESIHDEMQNSLLRLAEARVEADIIIDDLTEQLKKKDEEIKQLKENQEEKDQRLQSQQIQIQELE